VVIVMIIWINGAFGVGKTSVAIQLSKILSNSYVFDPEMTGEYIWDNLPEALSRKGDFQDIPLWSDFNYQMLDYIQKVWDGTVIVPMTIINPLYYEELILKLEENGSKLHHFILTADKEILLERLIKRGDFDTSWPANQIDRCIYAFDNLIQGIKIDTCNLSIDEVVYRIISIINMKDDIF